MVFRNDEEVEEYLNERARILADVVSSGIWGGTRGWEIATPKQFEWLVKNLRKRLNGNTDECITPVRRKKRIPRERISPDPRNSQPVDHNSVDEAPGNPEHIQQGRQPDL